MNEQAIKQLEGEKAELLKALQEAVDALAGGLWDYGPGQDEHEKCDEVLVRCRSVIAKVTGTECSLCDGAGNVDGMTCPNCDGRCQEPAIAERRGTKTEELSGALLDFWVAKAEGIAEIDLLKNRCEAVLPGEDGQEYWTEYRPSTTWETAGPIIERDGITTFPHAGKVEEAWAAWRPFANADAPRNFYGPTPLIAAMRCYVASKFGDEVPDHETAA